MKAYWTFFMLGALSFAGTGVAEQFDCGDFDSELPYAKLCGDSEIFEFKLDKLNFDKARLSNNISSGLKFKSGNRAALRAATVTVAASGDKPKLSSFAKNRISLSEHAIEALKNRPISREVLWDIISRADLDFPDRIYNSKSDYGEFGLIAQAEVPAPGEKGRVTFFMDFDAFLSKPSHAPGDYNFIYVIASLNNNAKYQMRYFNNSDFTAPNGEGYRIPASFTQPSFSVPVEATDTGKVILNIFARAPEKKYFTENAKGVKKKFLGNQQLKVVLKRVSAEVSY